MFSAYQKIIESAWDDRKLLKESSTQKAIREVIDLLDKGKVRVAEPTSGGWLVREWIKKAVILYFPIQKMEVIKVGPFEFHDKMDLKSGYKELGVRVVPHAIARYGSFVAKDVIMMPSYVNIGAYVDSGTMVDTWATVGSCAQIGKNVHLSGGVGVGGVLVDRIFKEGDGNNSEYVWIYIAGPLIGGILAGLTFRVFEVLDKDDSKDEYDSSEEPLMNKKGEGFVRDASLF